MIGLIIAYANRDGAGPVMRSHYTWLIRTFWFSLGGFALGAVVLAVGIPLSLILVGIPLVALGGFVMAAAWVYCAVRSVIGVIFLARDEPMPRPYALIA
ncbi:MAG TPA: hypothetical protein VLI41_16010 [Phenylobacterium sp.]|uniref:hypothetical protein n=1 Tax=Phenylobacterium sp. TaxID=1871053 RepID=UPI002C2FA3FD|nr:hypothetical protein [Phenylobacterium sp.]HSV04702.1 hypothetical protein [Phenylobacterium sp.]